MSEKIADKLRFIQFIFSRVVANFKLKKKLQISFNAPHQSFNSEFLAFSFNDKI